MSIESQEEEEKMTKNLSDWSKIPPDLLRSIFESLSLMDYHRARTVCSNWYSISSTTCKPLYPWIILFNPTSTLLFDPKENMIQKVQHFEIDFSKSNVLANCSSWLLIVDERLKFYLLNVFSGERINLPSMKSLILGQESIISSEKRASLWINERRRDYVVAWSCNQHYLFSYKNGDESWFQHESTQCIDLVCKRNKLYVLALGSCIKVFDLSENRFSNDYPFSLDLEHGEFTWKSRISISNSGEVLLVLSLRKFGGGGGGSLFRIYKIDLESSNCERVDSIGGEILIFGNGGTIRAPVEEINDFGIKSNSICFLEVDLFRQPNRQEKYGVFDLETSTMIWPTKLNPYQAKVLWFVPGYAQ